MPALMEGFKLSSRAAHVGFEWPDIRQLVRQAARRNARVTERIGETAGSELEAAGAGRGEFREAADPAGATRAIGRRGRRPFLRDGEHCAIFVARSRIGAAQNESQVPAAVFSGWKNGCMSRARNRQSRRWMRWKALWQESKRQEAQVSKDNLLIRVCDDPEEFETCVEIQREVWGFKDEDLVPSRLFVVAQKDWRAGDRGV